MLTWTERILSVPVRTAAVADFLRDLSAKGWGDLNGVLATFNDTDLCRDALDFWLEQGWIVRAPNSAITALVGPTYSRALTLREFCGDATEDELDFADEEFRPEGQLRGEQEEEERHEDR